MIRRQTRLRASNTVTPRAAAADQSGAVVGLVAAGLFYRQRARRCRERIARHRRALADLDG